MTGPELAAIVREHTERALAPVLQANKALEMRILELETRPAILGPQGVKGDPGLPGIGVASLILSAEGRLVAHLSDGRTLDAGPVPRGTDGAPGTKGDTGDRGEKGLDGLKGDRGDIGASGERGEKGLDGLQGAPGRDADPSLVLDLKSGLERLQATMESLPVPVTGPAGAPGVNGKDGVSVTVADVAPLIATELQKAVAAVPPPRDGRDGKDADMPAVHQSLEMLVQKAVAALPVPANGLNGKDGTSVTVTDVAPLIKGAVQDAVAGLPPPRDGHDGKDADMPALQQAVEALIAKSMTAIPLPKDGAPGLDGSDGSTGKDGIGVMDAVLDRVGHLIVTLSDGRTKDVGLVTGHDADPLEMKRLILEEVAKIPPPKDGRDGADGMTLDDAELVADEDGWKLRLSAGGRTKDSPFPLPHHQGPWKAGAQYPVAAMASHDGGWWIATKATADQPGTSDAWQLVVRRGKQGREGQKGKDGRDLTPSNTPPLY